MGYYSYFTVGIEKSDSSVNVLDIANWINEKTKENVDFFYPFKKSLNDILNNPERYDKLMLDPEESEIWHDHDEEMTELSVAFPNITFYLHVDGEEPGDSFTSWYKNGLSVAHHMIIPPLREEEWGDAAIKAREDFFNALFPQLAKRSRTSRKELILETKDEDMER